MDYYKILGVTKTSTQDEIKKAFHKLSLKNHPDKYSGNSPKAKVHERYQNILSAYDTLRDPEKKELYDRFGEKYSEMPNARSRNTHTTTQDFPGGFPEGFNDIFSKVFGQNGSFRGFPGGQPPNQRPQPQEIDQNIVTEISVTFAEAYTGTKKNVPIKRKIMCSPCRGKGTPSAEYIDDCDKCKGMGVYMQSRRINQNTIQQTQHTCEKCAGKGCCIREGRECETCKGKTFSEATELTEIPIPAGTDTNFQLMFGGQGHRMYEKFGDLIVVTKVSNPPKNWERSQNDLKVDIHITLREALLGFKKVLKHLDEREILLKHENVMTPHTIKRIHGEGFKNIKNESRGDLFLKFIVDFPTHGVINKEHLDKALPDDPSSIVIIGDHMKVIELS